MCGCPSAMSGRDRLALACHDANGVDQKTSTLSMCSGLADGETERTTSSLSKSAALIFSFGEAVIGSPFCVTKEHPSAVNC